MYKWILVGVVVSLAVLFLLPALTRAAKWVRDKFVFLMRTDGENSTEDLHK